MISCEFRKVRNICMKERERGYSVRKTREAYLIERGQILEPHGLNKKDDTLLLYQHSMFRSFVLFIAVHHYLIGCNIFPYFQFF